MLRWLGRILLAILLLLALAAAAITFILHTDYPRRVVAEALADELKMSVTIGSFHTGWAGHATLEDLAFSLPLEDGPLLTVPRMAVDHTGILWLILTRKLELHSLVVEDAHLRARQRVGGRWNVLDVLDRLATDKNTGEPADIPSLRIHRLRVEVATLDGKQQTYTPINATLDPAGGALRLSAELPGHIALSGAIDRGPDHLHNLTLTLADAHRLVAAWFPRAPTPLSAALAWTGRIDETRRLTGVARLQRLTAGDITAAGTLEVAQAHGGITLKPTGLLVRHPSADVRFVSGTIHADAQHVTADRALVESRGVTARLTGRYDIPMAAGDIEASWTGELTDPRLGHQGTLTAALTQPLPGRRHIDLDVRTTGHTTQGQWVVAARTQLEGESFTALTGRLVIPQADWLRDNQPLVALKDLRAELTIDGPAVHLRRMQFASPDAFTGAISADLRTRRWSAQGNLVELALPEWSNRSLSLILDARGDARRAEFNLASVRFGRWSADAAGAYVIADPKPLTADLTVGLALDDPAPDPPPPPGQTADAADPPRRLGTWQWRGRITGQLAPRRLTADGRLHGERVVLNRHKLDAIDAPLSAVIEGRLVTLAAPRLDLWGSRTAINTTVNLDTSVAHVSLSVDHLDIQQASPHFFAESLVYGTLDAAAELAVPLDDPLTARLRGRWSIRELGADVFKADAADGRIDLHKGVAVLDAVRIRRADGRADGRLTYDLNTRRDLTFEAHATRWPLRFQRQPLDLYIDGDLGGHVDTAALSARGKFDLAADVVFHTRPVGIARLRGAVEGRTLDLHRIETQGPLGDTRGQATIPLDALTHSTGSLTLEALDAAAVAALFEVSGDVTGNISGHLAVEPAAGRHVPEPLRFSGNLQPLGFAVRGVPVTMAEFVGYVGPRRLLLQAATVHIADGAAQLWGTVTRRDSSFYYHAQADLNKLNLDTLNKAIAADAADIEGRVSGEVRVMGPFDNPAAVTGDAHLRITESDLIHADLLFTVFSALQLVDEVENKEGRGAIEARVESGMLIIEEFRYFNRGASIFGDGRVERIAAGGDSPIRMFIVGTGRPFKELNIPFASFFDQFLTNLEATVTSVRVRGTLADPDVELVPLLQARRTLEAWFKKETSLTSP